MAIPRPILFAGTGVQLVFIPLRPELRYSAEQTGVGWQYCRCRVQDQVVELAYIQWQILRRTLILAVDTTVGTDDADAGYFAKASALGGDFVQRLSGLLGAHGEPLAGLPPIEFTIRPATIFGGEPRPVHLVVDFGNSRTSVLLVEFRGDAAAEPLLMPAPLCSRHQLDCSDELADLARAQANWSFSSRTHWCTTPYLPPLRIERVQYRARPTGGLFRRMPLADSPANAAETAPIHARHGSIPPPERVADAEDRTPRATPLRRLDENVQFTAFRPKAVRPACWHDLLVAAHLAEKRPDAPADEPEPIEKVRQLAEQLLGAQKDAYQEVVQDSRQAIPQGGEVTFVPEMDKVEFNPPRQSFLWEEDQHVTTFRLRASAELDRTVARGRVSVFLGAILVADIPLQIRVDSGYVATAEREKPEAVSARPYRKIFASYSHKDLAIVEQCERHAMVMGDSYLRDWKDLRAGEEWHPRLSEMIKEADVFQLFWSWQAMESEFVRQEWEHALALGRPNFVRPVYWETPFPERPGLPPEELRRIHFQCLCPETVHPAHTPPSLAAPRPEQRAASVGKVPSLLRGRAEPVPVTVRETPRTFEDFAMVRLGQDADDVADAICAEGEDRIGVSSPKRYLWAGDAGWLAGTKWLMADPFDRYDPEHHTAPLRGPFLRFSPEEDDLDEPQPNFEEAPSRPRHAPRALMTAALYEILCQAYTSVNSIGYRSATGVEQTRLLRSLTLTYPSGMIAAERAQLEKQACKAIRIFMQTLGKSQPGEPELSLSLDEATAAQLTYIWSELQKLGRNPYPWFSVMGRERHPEPPPAAADAGPPPPHARRYAIRAARLPRRIGPAARGANREGPAENGPETRIACIDIGAGNSNLAIAKYTCSAGPGGDLIQGDTLHREGIPVAGDHLVKRLLERIIVPQFVDAVGLDACDAQALFGREVPLNSQFRLQRIRWVNRLFVPLAHAYLENAGTGIEQPLSHTDPDIVAPEVLQSLQDVINRLWGPGRYNIKQGLSLCYRRDEFEEVVEKVFGDTFSDFCESIVEHRADIVLLAGRPSQLPHVQQLIETFLPLPASRIIPMSERYAGTWYPYQGPDNRNPGLIIDPKSTVAVGAAVELMARHGMLAGFRLRMSDVPPQGSYYWGIMTGSLIYEDGVIFERRAAGWDASPVERAELDVFAQDLFIGRRRRGREQVPASPAYLLRVIRGKRLGKINVRVTLARQLGPQGDEELVLESVVGDVDGEPAVQNRNVVFEWRTLADDHYYLDSGGLDQLELT